MRNFTLSRKVSAFAPAGRRALALWPLLVVACSVYDDTLVGDVATPLGGGSGSAGAASAGSSGSGNVSGGGAGASTSGGTDSSGAAGDIAGKGGGGGSNSVAGTAASGSASGGTAMAGAGGEPATDEVVLIDDMEDGDVGIDVVDGRNGYWYSGNDGTAGTQEPPSTAFAMAELESGDRSAFAASLKASGFTSWGSVMGFNFVEQATMVRAYDASAYCSVQFWGKAATTPTTVRLRVPDGDTHPSGNVCKDGGAANMACFDHFGDNVAFTTSWKLHRVAFSAMRQVGTGYHPADGKLKTDKLYALEWALPGMGKSYQVWVDDVAFVKCP